jgi:hypothetical protein
MSGSIDPPDSIFTWTFRAASGDSWGGWLVDNSDRYAAGSTLTTGFGTYTITVEEPQNTDLSSLGLAEGTVYVDWYYDGASRQFLVTRNGGATPVGLLGLGSELDAAWGGTSWDSFGAGGADQANTTDGPDSNFRWLFVGDAGDSLWGTLHDNSDAFAVGDTIRGAAGVYRILEETLFGADTGKAEGTVTTTRYRDAMSNLDLTLESGGLYPTGLAGLGSESDRAFDGSAWVAVGLGGSATVDRRPDASFSWQFEANSGDRWGGWLVGHAPAYAVGDTIAAAEGRYRITGEQAWAGDPRLDRNVWVVNYTDGATGQSLITQAWSQNRAAGTTGLGQEYDYAWDGDEWDDYGRGGSAQVVVEFPTLYGWRFRATSGDIAQGWALEDRSRWATGESWTTAYGRYEIYGANPWTGSAAQAYGTVWFTDYFDASGNRWLGTQSWHTNRVPVAQLGLGNELDLVWDGDNWDQAGQGGALQANVDFPTLYGWRFRAAGGDIEQGWVMEDRTRFSVGESWATPHGRYEIYGANPWTGAASLALGTVWLTDYFDNQGNRWLGTQSWHTNRVPVAQLGLGNETDLAWDGDNWDPVGQGGALQANVEFPTLFGWRFRADSGDIAQGWVLQERGHWQMNESWATPYGRYEIYGANAWSGPSTQTYETVWLTDYFDAGANRWLGTQSWHTNRSPVAQLGLGNESDLAWDGDSWDEIGRGGARQANVETPTLFAWRFRADSGDLEQGWVLEERTRWVTGDSWTTDYGRYEITGANPWSGPPSTPYNTVWLTDYFDAGANRWLGTQSWHTNRAPVAALGLGNETDLAWDGDNWDEIGLGGARQANVEFPTLFTWRFLAESGDSYQGWVMQERGHWDVAESWSTPHGSYEITGATPGQAGVAYNTVWLTDYFDAAGNRWLGTESWHVNRRPVETLGLGIEYDRAWDGDNWDEIGRGGALQADVDFPTQFTWRFRANSGDMYVGWALEQRGKWLADDTWTTAHGRYDILATTPWLGAALPNGTVWLTDYFDAGSNRWLGTESWHVNRRAVGTLGLGQELDRAWDGDNWDEIGRGGALQADVETASASAGSLGA